MFVEGGAQFSDCGLYRYRLSRTWNSWEPPALFVMLNPSTATADADDPTIKRCTRFAQRWGYGGLTVGNLFGYRATSPALLRTVDDPVGPDNDNALRELQLDAGITVVAWGAQGGLYRRDRAVLDLLDGPVSCLGLTASNQPRHPLYVPKLTRPVKLAGL